MVTKAQEERKIHLRWGTERRLEFIDFRLCWEGRINRSDLTEFFGISTPQASADIARYQELAPNNLTYDTRAKCYVVMDGFESLFDVGDSDRYLAQLRAIANGTIKREEAWVSGLPSFDVVPTPSRTIEPRTLKAVLDAIRDRTALKVRYQSMSEPEPMWRWITPHALGFDGFRWHARAFCHNDKSFKDFLFARILDVGETKLHPIDEAQDRAWMETLTVIVAPHPGLSVEQRKTIELDYGMSDGRRAFEVRLAFLYYFLKRLGLDADPKQKRPEDQHVVLINRKDVLRALKEFQAVE